MRLLSDRLPSSIRPTCRCLGSTESRWGLPPRQPLAAEYPHCHSVLTELHPLFPAMSQDVLLPNTRWHPVDWGRRCRFWRWLESTSRLLDSHRFERETDVVGPTDSRWQNKQNHVSPIRQRILSTVFDHHVAMLLRGQQESLALTGHLPADRCRTATDGR